MGNPRLDESGGAKPPNLNSRIRDLEDKATNYEIFIDTWVAAVHLDDAEQREAAMVALADMWGSLGG